MLRKILIIALLVIIPVSGFARINVSVSSDKIVAEVIEDGSVSDYLSYLKEYAGAIGATYQALEFAGFIESDLDRVEKAILGNRELLLDIRANLKKALSEIQTNRKEITNAINFNRYVDIASKVDGERTSYQQFLAIKRENVFDNVIAGSLLSNILSGANSTSSHIAGVLDYLASKNHSASYMQYLHLYLENQSLRMAALAYIANLQSNDGLAIEIDLIRKENMKTLAATKKQLRALNSRRVLEGIKPNSKDCIKDDNGAILQCFWRSGYFIDDKFIYIRTISDKTKESEMKKYREERAKVMEEEIDKLTKESFSKLKEIYGHLEG